MTYHLFKRKLRGKVRWGYWYRDASGGRRQALFPPGISKGEASLRVGQMNEREAENPAVTLREYAAEFFVPGRCQWLRRQAAKGVPLSEAVAQNRRSHLERYLFPAFGDLRLCDISSVAVENWLLDLCYVPRSAQEPAPDTQRSARPLSAQTKNHILYTLAIVLRDAHRAKMLKEVPAFEGQGVTPRRRDTLSVAELESLFPEKRTEFRTVWPELMFGVLYALMVSSGIRSGEIRALLWADIIWPLGGVLITKAYKPSGAVGDPKFNERRAVLLPDRTMALLSWWREEAKRTRPTDHVFLYEGRAVRKELLTSRLSGGLTRAGIDAAGRNLPPHSLRHTYNTRMKELLSENMLRDFTGHRSPAMTDRYDNPHLLDRLQSYREEQSRIDRFWRSRGVSPLDPREAGPEGG